LTLVACFLLSGCTTMVSRSKLPPPLTSEEFGDPVKVVSIPLPVIASSPNEGITAGALTAFLLHNAKDEVSTLIAPQVNYNKNFGTTGSLYGAFYPTPDRSFEINLSKSSTINDDYELKFRDKTWLDRKLELNGFIFALSDGSSRFFGFQSDSRKENESNYANVESGFNFSIGYDIAPNLQLVFGERFRHVRIKQGAIDMLPFIKDQFDDTIPGVNGFTTHAQRLALIYNSMDSRDMPTEGLYTRLSVESSGKTLGSSNDYRHYEVEIKGYIPLDEEKRFIAVQRAAYFQTLGPAVPFLERSILGGETTLRGYGRNRFIDSCYLLINLEQRIRLFRWTIFNVNADWEVAPFVDLGAVMPSLSDIRTRSFEFNPGLGLRAVVRPNIVGRVDIGFGKDGPAVFVGLGYPF
jgi:outer membrane protein assembly factor BamA